MKKLTDLLQDSYAGPEGSTSSGLFTSFAVPRGSASDRQLGLIEKLSHGSGDNLAEIRSGKSFMDTSLVESSLLIGTQSRYANE